MEKVKAWLEQFNLAGVGCSLSKFEQIFASADDEIKESFDYHYMCGLYHGRLLNEAFGGTDKSEQHAQGGMQCTS